MFGFFNFILEVPSNRVMEIEYTSPQRRAISNSNLGICVALRFTSLLFLLIHITKFGSIKTSIKVVKINKFSMLSGLKSL